MPSGCLKRAAAGASAHSQTAVRCCMFARLPNMSPTNLILTKAELKDNPYEVQLGVLRYIKELLSSVVDEALLSSSVDHNKGSAGHDDVQDVTGSPSKHVANTVSAAPAVPCAADDSDLQQARNIAADNVTAEAEADAAAGGVVVENNELEYNGHQKASATSNESQDDGSQIVPERSEEKTVHEDGERRKRLKLVWPSGRDMYAVGSVVECFHVEDGLWYPATITASITVPDVKSTHEAVGNASEPRQDTMEETKTPRETGGKGNSDTDTTMHDIPSATGEEPLQHAFISSVSGGSTIFDVVFLGYGNTARVPADWVKEVSSPEVLQWCIENGIDAENESKAPVLGPGGDISATEVLMTCEDADGTILAEAAEDDYDVQVVCRSAESKTAEPEQPANGSSGKQNGFKKSRQTRKEKRNNRTRNKNSNGNGRNKNNNGNGRNKNNDGNGRNKNNNGNGRNKNNNGNGRNKNNNGNGRTGQRDGQGKSNGISMIIDEKTVAQWGTHSRSPYPHVPNKYWGQRYRYFSRYDEGVTMDMEGWYSVTPEAIARHIAERVCCDVIVDPFVGCGGNAVQFALVCHLVIAIDLDPVRLEHCRRNAAVYGVEHRIEFILGDAMKILPTLKADAVFLSPPWGGPDYQASKTFDMHTMIPAPLTALEMFRAARAVTPNVVFFLPRNVDAEQVGGLPAAIAASSTGALGQKATTGAQAADRTSEMCELELQYLNGKLKTTTAYYGEDIVAFGNNNSENAEEASKEEDAVQDDPELEADESLGSRWSGQHVRFSSEEEISGNFLGDGIDDGKNGDNKASSVGVLSNRTSGLEARRSEGGGKACTQSQQRENMLYDAWMAAAAER